MLTAVIMRSIIGQNIIGAYTKIELYIYIYIHTP